MTTRDRFALTAWGIVVGATWTLLLVGWVR